MTKPDLSLPKWFNLFIIAVFSAASLVLAAPVLAQDAPALTIDGAVAHPLTLTAGDLAALPQSDVHVAYLTGHGSEDATYSGVSLWSLIEKAGLGDAFKDRKTHTSHYLTLSAKDGYVVVLALGEIDPDLEGKPGIIALKRDGKPIDAKDTFRLALPGDKHGARNMHQLSHITLN
jgi:hypothetical protein